MTDFQYYNMQGNLMAWMEQRINLLTSGQVAYMNQEYRLQAQQLVQQSRAQGHPSIILSQRSSDIPGELTNAGWRNAIVSSVCNVDNPNLRMVCQQIADGARNCIQGDPSATVICAIAKK